MKRSLCLLFAPALLFLASAQEALNNEAIVKMVKSGLGENLIVSMIQGQPGKYSLNPDELVKLEESGLSEKILSAMAAKGNAASPSADASGSVKIGLKTPVKLVLDETVSSKTAKPGDTFKLVVAEDVVINGHVVIAKGAAGTGRITAIKKKSFATQNGFLEAAVDSVRAVDGHAVAVEARIATGGEGASFGHFGKEAEVEKGYVVNAVVASETEVKF
jgi:hypothetical protein